MFPDDLRRLFIEGAVDETSKRLRPPASLNNEVAPADLVLFEPRMTDRRGHFALLADQYLALAKSQGLSSAVFHGRGWSGPRTEGWHSLFHVPDHFVGAGFSMDPRTLERYTHYFENTLVSALRLTEPRIAVFPTARFLTLPAIASAVSAAASLQAVIIGVMETWPVPDCDRRELVENAFRATSTSLAALGVPVQVFAESQAIAEDLGELGFGSGQGIAGESTISVQVAPYPAAARLADRRSNRGDWTRPRFLALGASRPVHNPGVLAEYLLAEKPPPGHWSVRLNERLAGRHLDLAPGEVIARLTTRGIDVLPQHLDQQAYDQALLDADAMLLPYGDRYASIGSGIFLECLCAGVIPLVPTGSTMRSLYEALGGAAPAIVSLSPTGIAKAVDCSMSRLTELRINAGNVRDRWLRHAHGPERWSERVTELLTGLR